MAKRVALPDGNIGEFPDAMPDSEIEAVLRKEFPEQEHRDTRGVFTRVREALAETIPFPAGDWPELGPKFRQQIADVAAGIAGEPARIAESLRETGKAWGRGETGAFQAAGAVPLVGPPAQQIAREVAEGKYPEAGGHTIGLVGPAAIPVSGPAAAAGGRAARAAQAVPGVAAEWAARKVVSGGMRAVGVPGAVARPAARMAVSSLKEKLQKMMSEAPEAQAAVAEGVLLDDISQAQAGKKYANLSPEQQQTVRNIADSIKAQAAPERAAVQTGRPPGPQPERIPYVGSAPPVPIQPTAARVAPAAASPTTMQELVEGYRPAPPPMPPGPFPDISRPITMPSNRLIEGPQRVLTPPPPGPSPMRLMQPRQEIGVHPITGEPMPFYTGESAGEVAQIRSAFGEATTPAAPAPAPAIVPPGKTSPPMAAAKAEYHKQVARVIRKNLAEMLVDGGISPDDVARITPDYWKAMAEHLGVPMPPPRTVKRIPAEMRTLIAARKVENTLGKMPPGGPGNAIMAPSGTQAETAPRVGRARGPESPSGQSSQPLGASGVPGAATRVEIPGSERSYGATYEVRELSEVQASHSGQTFEPNPKYGLKNDRDYSVLDNRRKVLDGSLRKNFKPSFHITDNPDMTNGPIAVDVNGNVLGGNGRWMILDRVYAMNPEGAQAYRTLLEQKAAQYGLDPSQIKGMKKPVLVRRLDAPDLAGPTAAQDAITEMNLTGTAVLRPGERAIADSRRVSLGTMDDIARRLEQTGPDATLPQVLQGKSGAEVLNKLIDDGVISPQERAALAEGDALTKAGKERIGQLFVGRFFRDPAQLETISQVVRAKLERIAAPLARADAIPEWSLVPKIQDALDLLEAVRAYGGTDIDKFVKQSGLFTEQTYTAPTIDLAKKLQKWNQAELTQSVARYIEEAEYARDRATRGPGLFGDAPPPMTPAAAYREALGKLPVR